MWITLLPTDLITEAIVALAERGGSSRQALKSYIKEKYPVGENFDTQFNLAVKRGLESEYFSQPKGPAGSIKLVKKPKAEKPKAEKKSTSATKKPTSTVKKESPAASKKSSGKVTKKVVKKESQKKSDTKKSAVKKAATKKAATKTKKAKK